VAVQANTWPPIGGVAPAAGSSPASPPRSWPPASFPSKAQLDYTQALVLTGLLLLALPWLVGKLLTDPGEVLGSLGRAAARKPGG
jgi:hypothetical protein